MRAMNTGPETTRGRVLAAKAFTKCKKYLGHISREMPGRMVVSLYQARLISRREFSISFHHTPSDWAKNDVGATASQPLLEIDRWPNRFLARRLHRAPTAAAVQPLSILC